MQLSKLVAQAERSKFGLWKLNIAAKFAIPFNKPHGINVVSIGADTVEVRLPYWRVNQNHLKGLHACALATTAEFSSGLLLLSKLGEKRYRLIMQSLQVEYHYQAKMESVARFTITEEELNTRVRNPLETQESVLLQCKIEVNDKQGNHICTAHTNWQIKSWDKVKTKVT